MSSTFEVAAARMSGGHRRPPDRFETSARAVPELRHRAPIEIQNANRRIAAIPVLGMGYCDERLIAREIDYVGRLSMLVDAPRRLALAQDIDRRALVAPRSTEHADTCGQAQTRAVGRLQAGRR